MSKPIKMSFAGKNSTVLPESPRLRNPAPEVEATDRSSWTMGGKPLDPAIAHLIPYENTDQGIAERQAKFEASREGYPTVEFGADPLDKAIQQRRDQLEMGMEPWEAADPLREVSDAHKKPGTRHRFLSPNKVDREGTRGWKPVLVDGSNVKVGNLLLAEMPEEKAVQRNRTYQSQSDAALEKVEGDFMEQVERARKARTSSAAQSGLLDSGRFD